MTTPRKATSPAAKKTTPTVAKKATAAAKGTATRAGGAVVAVNDTYVLRPEQAPESQLDFDDRHDSRATQSAAMLGRYTKWHEVRTKGEWQRLWMRLVMLGFGVAFFVIAFLVVAAFHPDYRPMETVKIVSTGFVLLGGGLAVKPAARATKAAYGRWRGRRRDGAG